MRDSILLYLNGERLELRGGDVFLPLSRFLRERRGLTGLKVVCGEGACGACTVLVGEASGEPGDHDLAKLTYKAVNSCLHPVFQMHGCHVVTVEGLPSTAGELSPIQTAMVEKHGSQCGYCTPGIVMSLTGLFDKRRVGTPPPAEAEVRVALAGNLCRCTGYLPILEAAEAAATMDSTRISNLYGSAATAEELASARAAGVSIVGDSIRDERSLLIAERLDIALAYRAAKPGCRVVAGGTGFAGGENLAASSTSILSLGRISELRRCVVDDIGSLFIGASVTWSELGELSERHFPELGAYLHLFGSAQIRHRGTVGGSVAHAEGNADILPLLLVQGAAVHLASMAGERVVPIADFLIEKCGPTELLTGITLPMPQAGETLRLFKVRRRQAFDRSVFCAAIVVSRSEDGSIESVRIACGGVGPMPTRLPQAEAFLAGKPFTEETMRVAGAIAAGEISPIDDAYASAEYRRQLAANVLLRYFWNVVEVGETGLILCETGMFRPPLEAFGLCSLRERPRRCGRFARFADPFPQGTQAEGFHRRIVIPARTVLIWSPQ